MKHSSIYSDIVSTVRTVEDAEELEREIDLLLASLFRVNVNLKKQISQSVRGTTALAIEASLKQANMAKSDREGMREFFETLKKQVRDLPIAKLTLAFAPTQKTIATIFSWVTEQLGKGMILDITVDESIIGGAVVDCGGRYADCSIRSRLDAFFKENRKEIRNLVKS